MVRYGQEMVRYGQEMFRKCQEMSDKVRKWSGNVKKCQEMDRRWSVYVRKCQEIVRNGPGWSEMVQKGPRWSKIPKRSNMLEALKKIHFAYTRPERQRREYRRQRKETLDHPPHFYGSIFFLCSFLFSLIKSFHMAR